MKSKMYNKSKDKMKECRSE